ncbi:MAG: hypothetical protein DMG77_18650 [Acidobacteria bacterium]|nr:MAG: hypothetical protein DMG77_18650 [Acidobacteriota bacterium]
MREAISIEQRYRTSHVVHVDNLDARKHLGYAKHAIVHAKAASLRAEARLHKPFEPSKVE